MPPEESQQADDPLPETELTDEELEATTGGTVAIIHPGHPGFGGDTPFTHPGPGPDGIIPL